MVREEQPVVLVSACLLGVVCNHRGQASASTAVAALAAGARLIAVCPEVAGGLATPRPSAELLADGRVVTAGGDDLTDHYLRGAAHAVALARATGASKAVLKARSPSCGCHEIYDGTFSRRLRSGAGVTASALLAAGVEVMSDEDLSAAPSATGAVTAPTIDSAGA